MPITVNINASTTLAKVISLVNGSVDYRWLALVLTRAYMQCLAEQIENMDSLVAACIDDMWQCVLYYQNCLKEFATVNYLDNA